jgi:periplasmic protein TonB
MSDQPRPSHELFHDVTDTRPRAGRAAGGTLAVSIVAHALILAAVIVVPLLATGTLPVVMESVDVFRPDAPLPPDPPRPVVTNTATTAKATDAKVAPVEAPDEIGDEPPLAPSGECAGCVVHPTVHGDITGVIGSTGDGIPQLPPPPPPVPQKPVRVTALNMPTKVHDVAPIYPTIARAAGVEGMVIIEAVIAVDGTVRDARVLRSVTLLDHAALDAVKQWRYAPTRLNGVAVPVIVTVTVHFRLQR